ncbi:hypothetical protein C8R43DRAFT_1040741 [Mycena crocata]|nr:hypothetical protein C8R43DRAFT_1040741 [Mycena crocata]
MAQHTVSSSSHPHPSTPTPSHNMFFSASLVSAFMLLTTVQAIPQPDNGALVGRASCPAGYYPKNGACVICPPGNTCDGRTGPAQCDTGHAAPNNGTTGVCPECPAGSYQDKRGGTTCISCPAGTWGPYPAASSCRNTPSGWFQSQPGRSFRCGTCCGWEALQNGNIYPTNCSTTAKPYADPNSGNGCVAQPQRPNCVHAATCLQDPVTGKCPAAAMNY